MINVRKYMLYGWLGMATPRLPSPVSLRRYYQRRKTLGGTGHGALVGEGMLRTTGARCRIEGLDNIPHGGPFIVMSNHRSHLDTPVLIEHLPFLFGFIVKELMKIPVFSAAMRTIGCVAVSRGKGKGDYSVLDRVAVDVAGGKDI